MRSKLILLFVLSLTSIYGATAISQGSASQTVTIKMRDYDFQPQKITVQAGTTVEWINIGKHVHTVTDEDSAWDSGDLRTGEKFTRRFDQKGTYKYVCVPHEEIGMTGTIIVN